MSQQDIFRFLKVGVVLVLLTFVGALDWLTGYEVSVFPLYAVPIAIATWLFGLRTGVATAGAATLVWFWADAAAGHTYSRQWIAYVNAGARLIFFLIAAVAADSVMRAFREAAQRRSGLSAPLPQCADCGKIRDGDGYWWDIEAWLRTHRNRANTTKLCPDCARRAYVDEPPAPLSR